MKEYPEKSPLSSIAQRLGVHPARLTEMITKDNQGNYKRRISPYFLGRMLDFLEVVFNDPGGKSRQVF